MSALLFDMPAMPADRVPLFCQREELHRELCAALQACDEVPAHFLDAEAAKDAFRDLAKDGDESAARDEIRECFEMAAGFGKYFDRLLDHVNTIGWAYWRLHRAERRAYGKERA